MSECPFHSLDHVTSTFERVLATSPADETELVWFERRCGSASYPDGGRNTLETPRLTVLIRVVEGRRQGWHRTECAHASELESGLRQALALAKVQPPVKKQPVLPTDKRRVRFARQLRDDRVSELDVGAAEALLAGWCGDDLRARLHWSETRLAVWNSHGVRRSAASTELSLRAVCGDRPGCGHAAGSARSFDELDAERICARARDGRSAEPVGELPDTPVPVLLAPEATIELLNVLNTFALAGRSYLDGTSFLIRHRNVQVFDRAFNLRDDATRVPGVPFPFDLEGTPKRALDLVIDGQPSVVALTRYQGAKAGMTPTAQAVGGEDAFFGNLFLLPGELAEEELLAAADGGIRVSWLDPPECYEPSQLRIRALARGVRRIENGRLGRPLPDFVWEESLLRALARLRGLGRELVARSTLTTPLGGISAPALVLVESDGFQPAHSPPQRSRITV